MRSASSKYLEKAVEQLGTLPGVGRKSAMRFALNLLNRKDRDTSLFIQSIIDLRDKIKQCSVCNNISDNDICDICSNERRDNGTICIVESVKDLISIEATSQYKGKYHILGGLISPMHGIGPNDIAITKLLERINNQESVNEIIFALSATIEGDTTGYYIYKKIAKRDDLNISTIAKGIAIGNDLEYTDELTLGRSITNRVPLKF